jgi:hypothetical protein
MNQKEEKQANFRINIKPKLIHKRAQPVRSQIDQTGVFASLPTPKLIEALSEPRQFVCSENLLKANARNVSEAQNVVLPAKIFQIKDEADLGVIAWKLKDFREEEDCQTESGQSIALKTEILDLKQEKDSITGIFSRDFVQKRYFRRELVETPITEETPFWIKPFKQRVFIIVSGPSVARGVKKLLTNYVANKLSKALFIKSQAIVEARIPHARLKELHESNPQATRLIWFDQVDIPGVEKLCLAGSDLADTELYHEYLKHGQIWYVVFEAQKRGIMVGITRNCVVTLFSKGTSEEFMNYILEDLLTLIE